MGKYDIIDKEFVREPEHAAEINEIWREHVKKNDLKIISSSYLR